MHGYDNNIRQIAMPVEKPLEPYTSRYVVADLLGKICTTPIVDFGALGQTELTEHGHLIYIDNGSDVLAVGHLDTVVKDMWWRIDPSGRRFFSPQLDDRLGVYLLLDVLPAMGLKYDIILTDSEEIGKSTAQFFKPTKKYNWIFEIDRMGSDVALYQYMNQKDFVKALEDCKIPTVRGSNTDITYMESLGIAACNFACCYLDNHSERSYADLDKLDIQLDKIIDFYWKNKDVYYPWVKEEVKKVSHAGEKLNGVYNYGGYNDYGGYQSNYAGVSDDYTYWKKNDTKPITRVETAKRYVKEDACHICESDFCCGIDKCDHCRFYFHSDLFVVMFGYCKECLLHNFGVSMVDIDNIKNVKSFVHDSVKNIFNLIEFKKETK